MPIDDDQTAVGVGDELDGAGPCPEAGNLGPERAVAAEVQTREDPVEAGTGAMNTWTWLVFLVVALWGWYRGRWAECFEPSGVNDPPGILQRVGNWLIWHTAIVIAWLWWLLEQAIR